MYILHLPMHGIYRAYIPTYFYKDTFRPATHTFAVWILQGFYDLTDADYSLLADCKPSFTKTMEYLVRQKGFLGGFARLWI